MGEVASLLPPFTPGSATTGLFATSSSLAAPPAAGFATGESAPPSTDPALRLFQAAADDESLHAAVLGNSAHLRVQTATGEDLSLHLRVRDGIADVRVDRPAEVRAPGAAGTAERAEPRAELKASEVQAALAGEGLALGRFESATVPQQPHHGDGDDAGVRAPGISAPAFRASWAAPASPPTATIGNPGSEPERPPSIRLPTAPPSGGAPGSRPVSGSAGTLRAAGYDLGARRPGPEESARVVAGLPEIARNAIGAGTSAGTNPQPNLDQRSNPNPNPNPNQNPGHATGPSTAAHATGPSTAAHATGGAATGAYSSPHQHHQRHPHREGAADGDGVRQQRTSAPARAATNNAPGAGDPHTGANHGDGTPGVHVTA
jgi:hypothetical protein